MINAVSLDINKTYYPDWMTYTDTKDLFYTKVTESLNELSFTSTICANAYIDYVRTNKPYIAQESFSEFKEKVVTLLRKILKKFIEFFDRTFDITVRNAFDKFDKFLNSNARKIEYKLEEVKPFVETGYKYTITQWDVKMHYLHDTLDEYGKARESIARISKDKFIDLMEKYDEDLFDKIRGKMVKLKRCDAFEFPTELFKRFRNRSMSPEIDTITGAKLSEYIDKYKEYRTILNKTKEHVLPPLRKAFDKCEKIFENTKDIVDSDINRIQFTDISYSYTSLSSRTTKRIDDVGDEKILRYSIYYTRQSKIINTILTIFIKTVIAKMNALIEALSYYKRCIMKGLKLKVLPGTKRISTNENTIYIESDIPSTETYVEMVNDIMIVCEKDMAQVQLQSIYEQAAWILDYKGSTTVTESDVEIVDRRSSGPLGIKSVYRFFVHMIELVKRLLSRFMQGAADLIISNKEWLNKNAHKFDGIPDSVYDRMNITIIPYNSNQCIKRLNESVDTVVNKDPNNPFMSSETLDDEKKFYQWAAPDLFKINPDDSQKAALTYYRGGSDELVTVRGANEVRSLCQQMLKYTREYDKLTNTIKTNSNKLIKKMEDLEKKIEQDNEMDRKIIQQIKAEQLKEEEEERKAEEAKAAKQAAVKKAKEQKTKKKEKEKEKENTIKTSKINNKSTKKTTNNTNTETGNKEANYKYYLRHATFDIVLEDDKTAKNGGVTVDKPDEKKPLKATIRGEARIASHKAGAAILNKISDHQMALFKLQQRVLGAQLTIAEEKYKKYVSVLKDVVHSGISISDTNANQRASSQNTPDNIQKENEGEHKKTSILGRAWNKLRHRK